MGCHTQQEKHQVEAEMKKAVHLQQLLPHMALENQCLFAILVVRQEMSRAPVCGQDCRHLDPIVQLWGGQITCLAENVNRALWNLWLNVVY